tara:strand:+ start:190 stop:570 length:381 start_codon:yes stop_codon:yes gene_type:complete
MNLKGLKKLRSKKFIEIKTPLMLSINKKNSDKYFSEISKFLESYNFNFIKNCDDSKWDHYIYGSGIVELSFNDLKKITKKIFPKIECEENTWYLESLDETSIEVEPCDENDTLFCCFELKVPFERL